MFKNNIKKVLFSALLSSSLCVAMEQGENDQNLKPFQNLNDEYETADVGMTGAIDSKKRKREENHDTQTNTTQESSSLINNKNEQPALKRGKIEDAEEQNNPNAEGLKILPVEMITLILKQAIDSMDCKDINSLRTTCKLFNDITLSLKDEKLRHKKERVQQLEAELETFKMTHKNPYLKYFPSKEEDWKLFDKKKDLGERICAVHFASGDHVLDSHYAEVDVFDKAIEHYQRAVGEEPIYYPAVLRLAIMWQERSQDFEEKQAYQDSKLCKDTAGEYFSEIMLAESGDPMKAVRRTDIFLCKKYEDALCRLAEVYLYGLHHVKQDSKKAMELILKAHKRGYMLGTFLLGSMYERGIDVEKDQEKAAQYYQKSIQQGLKYYKVVYPQFSKGYEDLYQEAMAYYKGRRVTQDYNKAFNIIKKGTHPLGEMYINPEAFNTLGWMYENGQGCERDIQKALKAYYRGMLRGSRFATLNHYHLLNKFLGTGDISDKYLTLAKREFHMLNNKIDEATIIEWREARGYTE